MQHGSYVFSIVVTMQHGSYVCSMVIMYAAW